MTDLKNNRWLSIVTIILLIANIATLLLLWNNRTKSDAGFRRQHGPNSVFEFLTKELALDASQQAAYTKLRDEHRANQQKMQDSTRKAKDALFDLLQQKDVPDSLLEEYSKKVTVYDQQMDIITFRHFQKLRALCNPLQQNKFDELIKDVLRRMPGQGHRPPGHSESTEDFPGPGGGPPKP